VRRKIPWLHIALFILTFFTTVAAGAIQKGIDLTEEPGRLWEGLPFALTLMTILMSHELSHYFASRAHRTRATLPYFIPAPTFFGTFGAFIKMTSPILSRRALVDIGASGPIVGFMVSVAACAAGLIRSEFVFMGEQEPEFGLGSSILFSTLAILFKGTPPEGYHILLHPVAFAGWIGLFITFLNLMPIGQLDGGHIAFALLGYRHRALSMGLVALLVLFGAFYWSGWLVWAVLMIVLGLGHPPIMHWESSLDPRRRLVGAASAVIFVITFMPQPFIFPMK